MGKVERIHSQFQEIFREPGYSAHQIERMLMQLGCDKPSSKTIKNYLRENIENGLAVDLEKTGIDLGKIKIRYLIPRSNLETLIQELNMNVTILELGRAARELGYKF